ncbi:uncharacterized protein PG998_004601 [Apiospora kogelbergensis]|uniref:uncharacterized protein n=1 Tax=Apiospora kogelbergensis TaxID=1337665 RepID=UPI00312D0511
MVGLTLNRCALALVVAATFANAVDPSPAEKKKWDDKCKAITSPESGQLYYMVFDANGQPTGTCSAPGYKGCYWGPYKDPKTGQDGCCEKGNGVFSTDPVATLEGGCCLDPLKWSHDTSAQKGGCCPDNTHLTWDLTYQPTTPLGLCCPPEKVTSTDRTTGQNHCCHPGLTYSSHLASGQGECCEPGKTFSFDDAAQKGDCCDAGQEYKVDPATGKGGCCAAGVDYTCECSCNAPKPVVTPNPVNPNPVTPNPVTPNPPLLTRPRLVPRPKARRSRWTESSTRSSAQCMALCSADPQCNGANIWDDGASDGCLLFKEWEYPATGLITPGDPLMSFVPVTKR